MSGTARNNGPSKSNTSTTRDIPADLTSEAFHAIFDHAGDAIFIHDLEGRFLEVNRLACERLGYSRDDLLRMGPPDIDAPGYSEKVRPRIREIVHAGRMFLETVHRTRDGRDIPTELSSSLIQFQGNAAILSIARDISERVASQKAQRESERRYRTLFEKTLNPILIIDGEGRYVGANRAATEFLEIDRDELLGKAVTDFQVPGQTIDWKKHRRLWESGGTIETDYYVNGQIKTLDLSITPLETDEGTIIYGIGRDITRARKAERELRRQQNLVEEMQRISLVGGWELTLPERTLQWTEQVYRIHEMPRDYHPAVKEAVNFFPPPVRPIVHRALRNAIEHGEAFDLELPFITARGNRLWVRLIGRPFRESGVTAKILGTFQDISERKQTEQALRESEQKYRALFESSADGIFLMRETFEDCNEQVARMWRCKREDIIGKSPADFSPTTQPDGENSQEKARRLIHAALEGQTQMFYWQHLRRDGTPMDAEVTLTAVEIDREDHLLATIRDVTERFQAERQQRLYEEQIQHTQKLESLGVLAGGIAHDFNNLLTSILGNAEMACMELPEDGRGNGHIEEIRQASIRASELCNQMLAYSGKGRFVIQALDLNELVEEMTHLLRSSISKKAVLRFDFQENLPALEADASQIRQIVMNLITNASDALEDKPGEITVATRVMRADRDILERALLGKTLPVGEYICLEVSDTGCGMDEHTRSKLFDPFFTTKFTGRGLGLAAVLGIVRGHKGSIDISSSPGQGSTFRVLLPRTDAKVEPESLVEEPVDLDWRGSGTVLVVDDEQAVRALARRMLERAGFDVLLAGDGVEAVEKLKEHRERIVAILLDMTMPRMSGEEAYSHIREIAPDLPIILTSGFNEQDATNRFVNKDLAGFLQKPFRFEQVIRKFSQALA